MNLVTKSKTYALKSANFSLSLFGGFTYGTVEPLNPFNIEVGTKVYLTVPCGNFVCYVNSVSNDGAIELVGGVELLRGYLTERVYVTKAWNNWNRVAFDPDQVIPPDEKIYIDSSGKESRWAVIYRESSTTIPQKKVVIAWRLRLPEPNIDFKVSTVRVNREGDYFHQIGYISSSSSNYIMTAETDTVTGVNGDFFDFSFTAQSHPASATEIRILNKRTSFTGGVSYWGGYRVRRVNYYVHKATLKRVIEYEVQRQNIPFQFTDTQGTLDDTVEYLDEEPFYDVYQACEVFARLLNKGFHFSDGRIVFYGLTDLPVYSIAGSFSETLTSTYTHIEDWDDGIGVSYQAQGAMLARAQAILSRTYPGISRKLNFSRVSRQGDALNQQNVNEFIKRAWVEEAIQSVTVNELRGTNAVVKAGFINYPFIVEVMGERVVPAVVEYSYPDGNITIDLSNYLKPRRR